MKKKNILIASHSLSEAITQCIINNKHRFEDNITIISLNELLSEIDIYDEINDTAKVIRWYKRNNTCISNTNYVLLNRVLHIPSILFKKFMKNDREYAQRELEAYIGFAFNSFSGIGNKSSNGVCVSTLSLPQQWNCIQKKFSIKVPRYFWGPNHKNHLEDKDRLVYSDIYNYLNWSTKNNPSTKTHIFCFEKPLGEPIFIFSLGKKQLLIENIHLPYTIKEQIKEIAFKIHTFLNYFISEILIFIDKNILTFGCINSHIITTRNNKDFDHFVCHHLINEFYECLN